MIFKESVIFPRIIPREEIEQLLNFMYAQENKSNVKAHKFWLRDIAVIETLLLREPEFMKYQI